MIPRRLRKHEILDITGWRPSTLNEKVKDGFFPAPVYEGKIPFWDSRVVEKWVNDFFDFTPSKGDQENQTISA